MERRRILVVAAALVAVLGVVLVLLYVRGSDNRAKAQYAMTRVLVATRTVSAGETFGDAVKAGKLQMEDVVSSDKIGSAVTSLTTISDDEVAQAAIYPGEQILSARFGAASTTTTAAPSLEIPTGDVAITVSLTDPERVAGFVEPGSSVALFVTTVSTTSGGSGATNAANSQARVLLPKVLVLGVGSTAPETPAAADASSDATTAPAETLPNTLLTLAVNQKEAEKVLLATNTGTGTSYTLSMGLLNSESKISMSNIVGSQNLFSSK